MFDLGFSELLLVGLVALVVLGPERLPKAARFVGLWVRRGRAQWHSVRSELERELAAEELKRNLDAARTAATGFERDVRSAATGVETQVRAQGEATRDGLVALRDELSGSTNRIAAEAGERDAHAPRSPHGHGPAAGRVDGGNNGSGSGGCDSDANGSNANAAIGAPPVPRGGPRGRS